MTIDHELATRFRWLEFLEKELKTRKLLSRDDFAAQLGRRPQYVDKKHAAGVLYAYALNPDHVEKISAALPDKKPEFSTLQDFIKQGQLLVYPAWQIRKKGVIRPEVALAREGFALYAQELAAVEAMMPPLKTELNDRRLDRFFRATGGFSSSAVSDYIVSLDAARPKKHLTPEQFAKAWMYHENPFSGFG